ncbi:MAG: hypothetical protein HZY76_20405 [Anaerolineae bacterium]|nr:MAG: hypothetical protein HZY76_20405 [Anaerolineae bacterium]
MRRITGAVCEAASSPVAGAAVAVAGLTPGTLMRAGRVRAGTAGATVGAAAVRPGADAGPETVAMSVVP